jgi:hypothetical protein
MALEHQCLNTILIVIILLFNHAIYHEIILFRTQHLVPTTKPQEQYIDMPEMKDPYDTYWSRSFQREKDLDCPLISSKCYDEWMSRYLVDVGADDLFTPKMEEPYVGATMEQVDMVEKKHGVTNNDGERYAEERLDMTSGYGSTPEQLKTGPYVPNDLGPYDDLDRQMDEMAKLSACQKQQHSGFAIGCMDTDEAFIKWRKDKCKETHLAGYCAEDYAKPDGTTYNDPMASEWTKRLWHERNHQRYVDSEREMDQLAKKLEEPVVDDFPVRCPSGKLVRYYFECWPTKLEECDRLGKDGQCLVEHRMVDGRVYYAEPDHVYRCNSLIGRRSKKGCVVGL